MLDKLKAERRLARADDPHKWAEEVERAQQSFSFLLLALIGLCIWLTIQVLDLKRELKAQQPQPAPVAASAAEPPCTPRPGPSGQLPPPGFC